MVEFLLYFFSDLFQMCMQSVSLLVVQSVSLMLGVTLRCNISLLMLRSNQSIHADYAQNGLPLLFVYLLFMYSPSTHVFTVYTCIHRLHMYSPLTHVFTVYTCIHRLHMYSPSTHVFTVYKVSLCLVCLMSVNNTPTVTVTLVKIAFCW